MIHFTLDSDKTAFNGFPIPRDIRELNTNLIGKYFGSMHIQEFIWMPSTLKLKIGG